MHIEEYDYQTGKVLGPQEQLDFGNIVQGQHCTRPIVLRAIKDKEINVSDVTMYLIGSTTVWTGAKFGCYSDSSLLTGVEAGSSKLSQHISVLSDAIRGTPGGYPVDWDGTHTKYIWLDVQASNAVSGTCDLTYRFIYDHS